MPGPPPKPRDQRARRNKSEGTESTTVVLPPEAPPLPKWIRDTVTMTIEGWTVEVPKPPAKLLKDSRQAWATYWLIPETAMLRPHHMQSLRRLVRLYDEEERIRRRVAQHHHHVMSVPMGLDAPAVEGEHPVEYDYRLVKLPGHLGVGSSGQIVVSPDQRSLMQVRAEIRALEDRFAATPLAQYRVGWQRAAMLSEEGRAVEAQQLAEAAAAIAKQHQQLTTGEPT